MTLRVQFTPGEDDQNVEGQLTDLDTGEVEDLGEELEEEEEVVEEDGEEVDDEESGDEELILGKFKSVEDLAKAYQELQKQFTSGRQQRASLRLNDDVPKGDTSGDSEKAVDFSLVDRDIALRGEVSEATYKALAQAKIPRSAVDRYVRGIQAEVQSIQSALQEIAGGEDELKEVLQFARRSLSQAEKDHFDAVLDSGNVQAIKLVMRGIVSEYQQSTGKSGNKLVRGKGTRRPAGVKPFDSLEEVAIAMDDPRYETSASYRRMIDKRLAVSDL